MRRLTNMPLDVCAIAAGSAFACALEEADTDRRAIRLPSLPMVAMLALVLLLVI